MTTNTARSGRRTLAAALLVLPALLAACSAGTPDDEATDEPTDAVAETSAPGESSAPAAEDPPSGGTGGEPLETNGVRTFVAAEAGADGGEAVAGRLMTGPGGCLALEMIGENRPEGGAPLALVVWPVGTAAATGDRPGVDVAGVSVLDGDDLEATGTLAPPGDLTASIPPECVLGDDVVWIEGDVTVVAPF